MRLNPLNRGKLHRELGVAEDQPIPESILESALNSPDKKVKKAAQWALNRKSFGQDGSGDGKYGIRHPRIPKVK